MTKRAVVRRRRPAASSGAGVKGSAGRLAVAASSGGREAVLFLAARASFSAADKGSLKRFLPCEVYALGSLASAQASSPIEGQAGQGGQGKR